MPTFQDRIQQVMTHFNLSAKDLAEICDVQRSAISHILNGRNRPNVSFLAKLSEALPTLNTNWLLHGTGEIIANVTNVTNSPKPYPTTPAHHSIGSQPTEKGRRVTRVILLYNDGSFDSYDPQEG